MQTHFGPMFAWLVSVCLSLTHLIKKALFSMTSKSYTVSFSSSIGFSEIWGEGYHGDLPFETVFQGFFLSVYNVWLWISTSVPICYGMKFLWWWSKVQIYKYSRMSLVLSFYYIFSKPAVFGFILGLWNI